MAKPKNERRTVPRVSWQLPASVKYSSPGRKQVELRDVSSRGLFFFTEGDIAERAKIEIVLMMPPELQPAGRQWVCCHATVVRVEQDESRAKMGVAAVIDACDALPEI